MSVMKWASAYNHKGSLQQTFGSEVKRVEEGVFCFLQEREESVSDSTSNLQH